MISAQELIEEYEQLYGFHIIEPMIEQEVSRKRFRVPTALAAKYEATPMRILLAEDDEDTAVLMYHILKKADLDVTTAADGEEAVRIAMRAKELGAEFDCILMDLRMPKLDGYSAAATLRYKGYNSPIVALTGRPLGEDSVAFRDAGCDYFLVKSDINRELLPLILKIHLNE